MCRGPISITTAAGWLLLLRWCQHQMALMAGATELPFPSTAIGGGGDGQPPAASPIWLCPGGVPYFDTQHCDPHARSACPSNYKCRMAVQSSAQAPDLAVQAGKPVRYICCESRGMPIRDWLIEAGLVPSVFPQVPAQNLARVFVRDQQSGQVVGVENGADISLLPSDPSGFANYSRLDGVEFNNNPREVPLAGGFLHILVAINQLASPSALQLYYDYPSFGTAQIDLRTQDGRFARGYAQATGTGFVPAADFYRRQQVVLVFKSGAPLSNRSAEIDRWMGASDGKFQRWLFENGSAMAELLGAPLAGFIFNLTTRGSIFPVTFDGGLKTPGSVANEVAPLRPANEAPFVPKLIEPKAEGAVSQLPYNAGLQPETTNAIATTPQTVPNSARHKTMDTLFHCLFVLIALTLCPPPLV